MARADGPAKLVTVAPNWLGDAVMSLPALCAAAAAGGVTIAVATPPYTARVYWNLPGVDEVWVDAGGRRASRLRSRARALRAFGADAAVLLPPSFSAALAPWLAGVRHRIGFASDGRRALLTRAPAPVARTVHLSRAYEDLFGAARAALGLAPVSGAGVRSRLFVGERERAAWRERRNRLGISPPYVAVVPGAAYGPAKSWPWERYRALCERLARDVPVVLSGSASDRDVCARIAEGHTGVYSVAGETGLGEFFALVEEAALLVANDSGAPHVAAALDTPVVVLFGSTSPEWTAPLGEHVDVLQFRVHCNPCFRRTCPTQLECFAGIAVDEVYARAHAALGAARRTLV